MVFNKLIWQADIIRKRSLVQDPGIQLCYNYYVCALNFLFGYLSVPGLNTAGYGSQWVVCDLVNMKDVLRKVNFPFTFIFLKEDMVFEKKKKKLLKKEHARFGLPLLSLDSTFSHGLC